MCSPSQTAPCQPRGLTTLDGAEVATQSACNLLNQRTVLHFTIKATHKAPKRGQHFYMNA